MGKRVELIPRGWMCSLAECPPGPYTDAGGNLGFKTEYGTMKCVSGTEVNPRWEVSPDPDVYCLETGERWCPDVLVTPLVVEVTRE